MGTKPENRRVGIIGAEGRMGRAATHALLEADGLEVVALFDVNSGEKPADKVPSFNSLSGLIEASPEVVVDFTVAEASLSNLPQIAEAGIHAVVGTSGFTEENHEFLDGVFQKSSCLIVPNFAIGAVLMMRFAELASPWFQTGEIIEFHHNEKVDAPSGTAIATAERMLEASTEWMADPTSKETLSGTRGGDAGSNVKIHSVRMEGMVAHQEVLLGTTGQSLLIRHDTTDRSAFMPGVVLAAQRIQGTGLTVGLESLLGV